MTDADATIVGTSGVYSSNYGAENVFDNNPSTFWISELYEAPAYVQFSFDVPVNLSEYAIHFANGGLTGRAPKVFELQAKDSVGHWVSIDSPEPQTNWAGTETRTFAIAGYTEQYEDYRLLVTEDNDARSDIVVVSIASLSLKGTAK